MGLAALADGKKDEARTQFAAAVKERPSMIWVKEMMGR